MIRSVSSLLSEELVLEAFRVGESGSEDHSSTIEVSSLLINLASSFKEARSARDNGTVPSSSFISLGFRHPLEDTYQMGVYL